jgi:DUF4097 and DUF4098 domain-containing protein YvlB
MVGRPDVHDIKQFTHPAATTLRLVNSDGLVRISTHSSPTIRGSAEIRAFLRDGETQENLTRYVADLVEISGKDSLVHITTEPVERPDGFELFVVYDVQVPVGTNLEIESNNGNVWIHPGCGRVAVKGRNTDIDVRGPKGAVVAESINGRITVHEAFDGGRLQTVNGNVYADVSGGHLEAVTANGNIIARLIGSAVNGAALSSQNGGVSLEMPPESTATIHAKTARGSVRTKLPEGATLGTHRRKAFEGTVGNGVNRATIRMETLNGDISIARSSS